MWKPSSHFAVNSPKSKGTAGSQVLVKIMGFLIIVFKEDKSMHGERIAFNFPAQLNYKAYNQEKVISTPPTPALTSMKSHQRLRTGTARSVRAATGSGSF